MNIRISQLLKKTVIFACLLLCMLALPADEAQAAVTVGDFEFEQYAGDTGYTLTAYNGSDAVVTIPETVDGKNVLAIGSSVFEDNTTLTKVTFPATLESIGDSAFDGTGITQAELSHTKVTSIGSYAFSGCASLTDVTFPATLESIGDSAFFGSGITQAELSHTKVTSIGSRAFYKCASLTDVSFPSTLESIDYYAFRDSGITKAELSHTKVTSIGSSAFSGCASLTEVSFPDTLESIGSEAFHDTGITKAELSHTKVTSIGSSAFSGCASLTEISFPATLESIGSSAFSGCESLTEVSFPATLETIGVGAFEGTGITKADLSHTNVTSIGELAFYNCASLTEAIFPTVLESIGDWAFDGTDITKADLSHTNVTSIGELAFYNCKNLTEIRLPENITSVGSNFVEDETLLFCSRSSQTAKALGAENRFCDPADPDWLWSYDENETLMVAGYMGDARVITLPNDATVVAPNASWKSDDPDDREAITSITIPEGYTAIGDGAFDSGCQYLAHISLPSTLKTIGAEAFWACDFAMIQLPEGLATIGEEAFEACHNLESLTIPTTVKSIPAPIVWSCDIRSVVLHADLTYIADDAFGDDLTDVYCYRGSYAAQWAKEQNLLVHYINESTFSTPVVNGPTVYTDIYIAEHQVFDVGMSELWMQGISVLQEPGTEYRFVCTSSNPDVARVNGNMVEYLKPGKVTLTITLEGHSDATPYMISKEVFKPVENFSVPSTVFAKMKYSGYGEAYASVQFEPSDANPWFATHRKDEGKFLNPYRSVKNGMLHVDFIHDETGVYDVIITSRSGITKNIRVVYYNTIDAIEAFSPGRDLVVGEIYDPDIILTVDGSPIGNLDGYTITSSNTNVAVGVDGKHVKAVGRGTATITVKEANSKLSTSFTVTVDARDAMLTPRFLTVIGPEAFAGIGAKEIILYEECTEIQSRAFANCANLERIEIPASVETIADDAFEGCSKDMVIVTPSWSEAKKHADANGFKWENLPQ